MLRRFRPALRGILFALLALASVAPPARNALAADPAPAPLAYDVSESKLSSIRPGTVIGTSAPRNWSHLVLKSQPRIAQGDVKEMSQLTLSLSQLLSVVLVANVKAVDNGGQPRYMLDRVAMGLGTRIDGQDVIISSDTQSQLGAKLGLLARQVLSGSEDELAQFKQVLRSRTLLIFDAPGTLLVEKEHRSVIVRHALIVDAASGQLNALVWVIDKTSSGEYAQAIGSMSLVKPNTLEDRQLSVDAKQFTLGIPSSTAVALVRIAPGQAIPIPPQLLDVAAAPRFTQETARQLHIGLRDLILQAPSGQPVARENRNTPTAEATRARAK